MKKFIKILLLILFIFIIGFHLIRTFNLKEIDDVSPKIYCENSYLNKADTLWVIPQFNNSIISENKTWCENILKLNKTIGMHGITHSYHEFMSNINESDFITARENFKKCFGYEPIIFKAPNLALSNENRDLIKKYNMTIKSYFNQNIHKVYHCNDSGTLPNWFHDIF